MAGFGVGVDQRPTDLGLDVAGWRDPPRRLELTLHNRPRRGIRLVLEYGRDFSSTARGMPRRWADAAPHPDAAPRPDPGPIAKILAPCAAAPDRRRQAFCAAVVPRVPGGYFRSFGEGLGQALRTQ